ncbi:Cytochrome c2 [Jannaschia seosinensis]|uniref:Cytochrome c2 n=2 Tax=Jannaschia seosinensis TaxID=313367 RepID=A0A0M7BAU3_9RHOB|nr:Cytochrome c2 [Jannaschia seosinensis]
MIRPTFFTALTLALAPIAPSVSAEAHLAPSGDAAAGERAFRQCQACHGVQAPDGELLAGSGAGVGPNLYGVVGAEAAHVEGYRYSDLMQAAGEAGMVYDEATFVAYVMDPTGHLREVTGENGRSKMSYKVRSEEDAHDLYAFLAQYGDAEAAAEDGEASDS